MAVAPIQYRDNTVGRVAVSRYLNDEWLQNNKHVTEGEFFLIDNDRVIKSTLHNINQDQIKFRRNQLYVDTTVYRVYQIDLPGNNTEKPSLWIGLSEVAITAKLEKHRRFMQGLLSAGIIAILLLGLIITRSFNRPLNQIMRLTHQVAAGRLPTLAKNKVKNEFDELSNHFADMLKALREQQKEIEATQYKLEQSAITDSLTGLYNRRYLQEIFPKLLAQAGREGLCVYATMLDLDYFKKVNDEYGHIAGDYCLTFLSVQLKKESRVSDYLFRLGGEEFLILSVHKNIMEATRFADKIRTRIENKTLNYEGREIKMTISAGVSCGIENESAEKTLEHMLSKADIALYQAKNSGRNKVCMAGVPKGAEVTQIPTAKAES